MGFKIELSTIKNVAEYRKKGRFYVGTDFASKSCMTNIIENPLTKALSNIFSLFGIDMRELVDRSLDIFVSPHRANGLPSEHGRALRRLEQTAAAVGSERQIDEDGLRFIAEFEGFRGDIYKDVAGYPTIGYGHLIKNGEQSRFEGGISQGQALDLLREDAAQAVKAVTDLVSVPLNQNQFNALASFVFNVGRGNFARSTLLKKLNNGQYNDVESQLMRWVHAGGKRISGLIRRRQAEATLFNKPS
jgi:GH24 family phage-related lysozyme (muramidase)